MYKAFGQCLPHQAAGQGSLQTGSLVKYQERCWFGFQRRGGGRKQWSDCCWADVTFIYTFKKWRHWTSEPGRHASPLVEQQSGEGRRQPTCLRRLCAKCYQHRMLLLILPPDWVSLSPALPCPSPASTLPQCMCCNRKGRRTTPGVRRPWLRAGPPSAAAASWTTWTEQPRPKLPPGVLPPVTGINN